MFPSIKAVKNTSLAALKNHWPLAMGVTVIPLIFFVIITNLFSLVEYIFLTTTFLAIVYSILILVLIAVGLPLVLGVLRVLWSIELEQPLGILEVFYYFSSLTAYKNAITFIVLQLGSLAIKSGLLLAPSFIVDYISNSPQLFFRDGVTPLWVDNLWIFALFLRVIACACIAYVVAKYYMAPFIFITDKNSDAFEAINNAKLVSRTSFGPFLALVFSLVGWILLSLFFVPLVFTAPYFTMCYLVHSRFAVVFYNNREKKFDRGVTL